MKTSARLPHYATICNTMRAYGVSSAGLFGSRAFGDNKPDSDFDFVVDFDPRSPTTFLGLIELKEKLEDILGVPVDIVTKKSISPYLRQSILDSVIPIYGQEN